jgi:hypothetical protein
LDRIQQEADEQIRATFGDETYSSRSRSEDQSNRSRM